jgi:LmbE family N-acetylglucosaminyl deacetylase
MTQASALPHRVVAVAAHFDDVALSLAGVLLQAAGPIAVVTAHGGPPPKDAIVSDWDLDCGFVSGDQAYRTRRAEDADCCAVLGADQILLPNADGPYRPDGSLDGLDEVLRQIDHDVDVYLPLGTNQPDHARVRDQGLAALASRHGHLPRVLLYADLPYSAVAPGWGAADDGTALPRASRAGAAFRDLDARHGLRLVTHLQLCDDLWASKRSAVLCHASQLSLVGAMDEMAGTGSLLGPEGPLRRELVWELLTGSLT